MRLPALLACALLVVSCGGGATESTEVVVSAAASLSDAFTELAGEFERINPRKEIVLNLAGTSVLREQILEGAPVDVFAPADSTSMSAVADAGLVAGDIAVVAHNTLQIGVPAGNPGAVTGVSDFADADLLLGLCASGVPCGDLARRALANAQVEPDVDTEEPDVRALLTKLRAGELDAGIVYVTDVAAARPSVEGVAIPAAVNVVTDYPIAVLTEAGEPDAAAAFVAFTQSPAGREVLARHGFILP